MIKRKNRAEIVAVILAGCFLVPFFAAGHGSAAGGDWPSMQGSNTSPWISNASSPKYDNGLEILWSNIGTVPDENNMASAWKVPSTAISLGDYAYYYDGNSSMIKKVNVLSGNVVSSVGLTMDSMYNVPITFGNGRLFVPVLSGSSITVNIYNSTTLANVGHTLTPINKAQGMQGAVVYHNGYIYFGTYGSNNVTGIDFACFDENGVYKWGIDGGSWGYMMAPQFVTIGATTYCIMASEGTGVGATSGGLTIYVVNPVTGSAYYSLKIHDEYATGGLTYYNGSVYLDTENLAGTVTHIHSFILGTDGMLSGEKIWTSSLTGGTQSVPVIYNNRIYLGSGGATMGPTRNVEVIKIGSDRSMSTVYKIPILTKGTLTLTTAYANRTNDYTVYMYCTPYNGLGTNPDVYIIEDSAKQTVAKFRGIELPGGGDQYSFLSVAITSQGYLLIKNDKTLWCCRAVTVHYAIGDITCNGVISSGDCVMLAQYLAHMMRLTDEQLRCADTTGNGKVSIGDSVRLARYLAHQNVTLG